MNERKDETIDGSIDFETMTDDEIEAFILANAPDPLDALFQNYPPPAEDDYNAKGEWRELREALIRTSEKVLYAGKWKLGFMRRLQIYANVNNTEIQVCSLYGSLIFTIKPNTEVTR